MEKTGLTPRAGDIWRFKYENHLTQNILVLTDPVKWEDYAGHYIFDSLHLTDASVDAPAGTIDERVFVEAHAAYWEKLA